MRSILNQGWFQIALVGTVLFVITGRVLRYTYNLNYVPTFIVLGAFIVPVAFSAYFYRQEYLADRTVHSRLPLIIVSVVFLFGGIMGTIIAGLLEQPIPFFSVTGNFISVALIEEFAKVIFPVLIFLQGKYRSEIDGLVFGIVSGIGFAAFETMGYGLTSLMHAGVEISDLEQVLIMRGLFAPLGHAAWTALICGAIWHYQNQGLKQIIVPLLYFILAVVLHTLWDLAANADILVPINRATLVTFPAFIIIGGAGLFLVFRQLRRARGRP
jgi:protease PrsW